MKLVAFVGPSGAGKTRLLTRLIPALRARGISVAAIKHSGHVHGFDRRGKDSERLRRAGASAVALQGPEGLAYFGPDQLGVRALAGLLPPVDLVVCEGFKGERVAKVEVHRREVDGAFLCARDPGIIALVSREQPPRALPCFSPGEVEALAGFLVKRLRLSGRGDRRNHVRPARS